MDGETPVCPHTLTRTETMHLIDANNKKEFLKPHNSFLPSLGAAINLILPIRYCQDTDSIYNSSHDMEKQQRWQTSQRKVMIEMIEIEIGGRPHKGGNIRGENEQRNTRRGGGEKTK